MENLLQEVFQGKGLLSGLNLAFILHLHCYILCPQNIDT